jgi:hypothetical protein
MVIYSFVFGTAKFRCRFGMILGKVIECGLIASYRRANMLRPTKSSTVTVAVVWAVWLASSVALGQQRIGRKLESGSATILSPYGFNPKSDTVRPGQMTLRVHNRSGIRPSLQLRRVQGSGLSRTFQKVEQKRIEMGKRKWGFSGTLPPGTYEIIADDNPIWVFTLEVQR